MSQPHRTAAVPVEVAVIVPCRNAASLLGSQLESLARQTCALPWEVIVVNDGSTDNTVEAAVRYEKHLPRLRVLDNAGRGAASARNFGAAATSASSLLFLDADDATNPGYVQALGIALRTHALVTGLVDFDSLNDAAVVAACPRPHPVRPQRMFNYLPHAGGGCLGVRSEVFARLGGFDASLPWLHDADLCWRAQLLLGVDLHVVDDAVELLRLRDGMAALYRQGKANGHDGIRLRRRYAAFGVPWTPWSRHLRQWGKTARALGRSRTAEGRSEFAWRLGKQVGRLQGLLTGGLCEEVNSRNALNDPARASRNHPVQLKTHSGQ